MCSRAAEADQDPPRASQGGPPCALPPGVAALCRIKGPCPAGDALDKDEHRELRHEGGRCDVQTVAPTIRNSRGGRSHRGDSAGSTGLGATARGCVLSGLPGGGYPHPHPSPRGSRNHSSSEQRTRSTSPDGSQHRLEAQNEREDTI